MTIDHWKKLQKTDTAECIKNVTADTVFWMMKSLKITKHSSKKHRIKCFYFYRKQLA